MKEYLTFQPEKRKSRNPVFSVIFELILIIFYPILKIIDLTVTEKDRPSGQRRPVILIPGIFCSQIGLFRIRNQLHRQGYPVYIFNPAWYFSTLSRESAKLESFILEKNLKDIILIAHSISSFAVVSMGYKARDRVYKMFAFGTPYDGTFLAILFFWSPVFWRLFYKNPFSRAMKLKFLSFTNLQTIFASFDECVFPRKSARLQDFNDIMIPEIGHVNLVTGKQVYYVYLSC